MISAISLTTLSNGLATQTRVAETAAANIANVTTEGYQAQQGQVVSKPLQGAGYVPLPPEGGVDLGRELVNLTQAKQSYAAIAHSLASIDRTEKKALDALA